MAQDKIVPALVTSPTYINSVYTLPGERVQVNLTQLGVKELGDKTPGLEPFNTKDDEPIEQVPIAAVSPHAPNPSAPQTLAPGSVISGTGRTLAPANGDDDLAREMVAPEDATTVKVEADSKAAAKK